MAHDPEWARAQVRVVAVGRGWKPEQTTAAMSRLDLLADEWSDGSLMSFGLAPDEWFDMAANAMLQVSAPGVDQLAVSFRSASQAYRNAKASGDKDVVWNTIVASAQDANAAGRTVGQAGANIAQAAATTATAVGDVAKTNPTGLLVVAALVVLLLLARK